MSTTDKANNSAQRAKGKVKEAAGTVAGNGKVRAKGKTDQKKGGPRKDDEKVIAALRFRK